MASVSFHHDYVGDLTIDTGIDSARWAYGLNTVTFPTYGGEVVQILSVYIDDLTLTGTVTTYAQLGAIYSYFTNYMQAASQGNKINPDPGISSYNLVPMLFHYTERQWTFKVYPTSAPGFMLDLETNAPTWQVVFHVIDDTPDLSIIKEGIKGAALTGGISSIVSQSGGLPAGATVQDLNTLSISGELSPAFGDPNTDPFGTFDEGASSAQTAIKGYADYYNSLIPAYMKGDFSDLTGVVGSAPNFGLNSSNNQPNQSQVIVPKAPKEKG